MPRAHPAAASDFQVVANEAANQVRERNLTCAHCGHSLECVEQSRRSGTWLGSFMCAYCRSEYFYAYRWGRLLPKC